jgi:hypothetical protein
MTLEEIEKRLRTLEDIEAIRQLQARYVNCLSTIEWDDLVDCFAEDGVVDLHTGIARGKKEIEKFFKEKIAITHIGMEGNFVVHPVISIDGDTAKASWLLFTYFSMPHKIQIAPALTAEEDAPEWMSGFYDMEYVRENGLWKISLLKWRNRLRSPRK